MKVYSPLRDYDKKVQDNEYGYLIDQVKSRRILLLLLAVGFIALGVFVVMNINFVDEGSDFYEIGRYVPLVIFGVTGLWLINKAMTRLELYERGLVYKRLLIKKRYSYNKLAHIDEKRSNLNAKNHIRYSGNGLFSRMNSYHVSILQFQDGRSIKLSTPCFWGVKKKIKDLNHNLMEVNE
ncbi:hypothetical protein M2475_001434 [Breznakia sp. PF5-3]|uniref:DUF6585 family protein n=1 Tax=unclassified Breznakia TaxID=2623764 RepID=UPI002406A632|nr:MULTISPECIES: DUF6585 family protein [unclassified Breznakia]MDL2276265.1 hypothetical protein [Breznakia sp. OttesenSCG-928-G09]MDF9825605.1 hypothetical protein [Breznakia sp. PM6-1]MDF9835860.1 hypothetical protein [Breznakia sp. PF5-3]MDF9837605.1 hypothetical protein [Breznakia sp. PFB2-8]MDF9860014.1 hypothetical protein [Breznakia sp. PH5-24]